MSSRTGHDDSSPGTSKNVTNTEDKTGMSKQDDQCSISANDSRPGNAGTSKTNIRGSNDRQHYATPSTVSVAKQNDMLPNCSQATHVTSKADSAKANKMKNMSSSILEVGLENDTKKVVPQGIVAKSSQAFE